ncbi:MAG TPA: hypothetical protein VMS99_16525 [Acidimicrobiia bacterium]|nr:hypothetical protein [Acidimicrobiia bacterium]
MQHQSSSMSSRHGNGKRRRYFATIAVVLSACVSSDDNASTTAPVEITTDFETTLTTGAPITTSTPAMSTSSSTTIAQFVTYEIFDLEDVSFPGAVRYVAHVLTAPGSSVAELTLLAERISEEIRLQAPFQALIVGFYDFREYQGFGFVMGRWEFAPYGDWGRADEAELGNYSTFEGRSFLDEKDWSQRPSQQDVTIWSRWEDVMSELDPDLTSDDVLALESEAYKVVSEELDVPVNDVEQAVENAAFWPFS